MTQKEKAIAYDKALKVANKYKDIQIMFPLIQDEMFPELRESEDTDEKVRKALIKLVTNHASMDLFIEYDIHLDEALDWLEKKGKKTEPIEGFDTEFERQISHLIASAINREHEYNQGYIKWTANALLNYAKHELEKQDEQKSADKVEPKFKIGDWIVFNGLILYVKDIVMGFYRTISIGGVPNSYDCDIDNVARLWTIQDAKDGDVLATDKYYENIVIFKENHFNPENFKGFLFVHCTYDRYNNHLYPMLLANQEKNYHPATKEQRDLLFQKMKEKGYKWDFEKKELKKIEQKPDDKYEPKFKAGDKVLADGKVYTIKLVNEDNYIVDENGKDVQEHFSHTKDWKLYEQNPWSEEDERILLQL